MNIENIMQWNKSVTKGHILYAFIYVRCSKSGRSTETDSRLVDVRNWGEVGIVSDFQWGLFEEDEENVLKLSVVIVA